MTLPLSPIAPVRDVKIMNLMLQHEDINMGGGGIAPRVFSLDIRLKWVISLTFNTLKAELNPICHLLALLVAHHILHVSRIRVKNRASYI
jgi:hypothetical protein